MQKLFFRLSVVLLVASLAQGAVITNVTDGTTLFQATHENSTGEWSWPIAEIGDWTDGPGDIRATGNVAPAAPYGNYKMQILSPGSAMFGTVDGSVANETGDSIRVELAVIASAEYTQIWLFNSSPANRNTDKIVDGIASITLVGSVGVPGWGGIYETPNKAYAYMNGGFALLGDISATSWNTFTIDYVNGASTYSASVNGGTVASGTTAWGATGTLQSIGLTHRSGTSHFDVVPEPATMLLLGLGGLLIRRKK